MISTASRSERLLGQPGYPVQHVEGWRHSSNGRVRLDRYRAPLEGITDRQVLRRYFRYQRRADRAAHIVEATGERWAVGLRNQQLGRMLAACAELRARGLEPPSPLEAYLHVPASEVYPENVELVVEVWEWSPEQARSELRRCEGQLQGDPTCPVLAERWAILAAHTDRVMYPSPEEDVIERLEERLGYRWTTSEVNAVLGRSHA